MRTELAGLGEETATDALWLGAGALVAGAVVAVVMPAVHAAPDRLAAQQTRASAAERYLFLGSSVGLVVTVRRQVAQVQRLDGGHSGRIPVLSQAGDIWRDPGTVRYR
jgi:hypothetical protein